MQKATIYLPNSCLQIVESAGPEFTLKELQDMVGGYIEVLPGVDNSEGDYIVNEEGIRLQLELNVRASKLVGRRVLGNMAHVEGGIK